MEPLPVGANFRRAKMLWEIGLHIAGDPDLRAVQQREFAALDRCYASPEHREAIDAFIEKRPPDFTRARASKNQR